MKANIESTFLLWIHQEQTKRKNQLPPPRCLNTTLQGKCLADLRFWCKKKEFLTGIEAPQQWGFSLMTIVWGSSSRNHFIIADKKSLHLTNIVLSLRNGNWMAFSWLTLVLVGVAKILCYCAQWKHDIFSTKFLKMWEFKPITEPATSVHTTIFLATNLQYLLFQGNKLKQSGKQCYVRARIQMVPPMAYERNIRASKMDQYGFPYACNFFLKFQFALILMTFKLIVMSPVNSHLKTFLQISPWLPLQFELPSSLQRTSNMWHIAVLGCQMNPTWKIQWP